MRNVFLGAILSGAAVAAQAVPVTVSLGPSVEDFLLTGLGPNAAFGGRGTYRIGQGNCLFDGTNTTCTLSGAISSATNPIYGSGTYSFVTTHAGALSPVLGVQNNVNPEFFNYFALGATTDMTLNLFTSNGNFSEDLVVDGAFTGAGFSFGYVSTTCTGVAVCSQSGVGFVDGATITGPVRISATFDVPVTRVPEPGSAWLAGLAMLGLAAGSRRAAR
jgi:hypothetical protein